MYFNSSHTTFSNICWIEDVSPKKKKRDERKALKSTPLTEKVSVGISGLKVSFFFFAAGVMSKLTH